MGAVVDRSLAARVPSTLSCDSRDCPAGALFFAVPGVRDDGTRFLADAARAGALAAVVGRDQEAAARSACSGLPLLVVPNVRLAKAQAAHAFHGDPSRALLSIGVTGTKGKTTTANYLHALLDAAGLAPSLLGTIEERLFGQPARPSSHTTPDPLRLAALLAQARDAGGRSLAMEVSSHALDQERVAGMRFRAALFTQLAREHLDYHPTVEHYRDAKAKLFTMLAPDAFAVVNGEDRHALELVAASRARLVTYGEVPGAHVRLARVEADVRGSRFELAIDGALGGGRLLAAIALPGRHNLMNALAATAAALALELPRGAIAAGLAALRHVPGRLEPIDVGQPFAVLVDYAHTDDALEKILRLLRPLTRGQLLTVFGCGGDRDRTKRPRMGRVAARWSDRTIVTSDNPRSEDPAGIVAEIVAGLPCGAHAEVELDRGRAIARAIALAQPGDVVLIAGKGHEDYQLVGSQKLPFDDRAVAREHLCRRSV
ncbi:MAG: UDP-N-acetylmuramoyl-L-alanyl-D-glutamate--2,6-diaminopimelate ligase [Planctomycetes bacterium]|nr:UDP-N-acetylmuramoyl-L-alanyl-D-glutamate--2,6-diaminopimelate ligase [Planctomycetota bacterium]